MEEREKLKALLENSAKSGFTLQSGSQLQEWLERFSASVIGRAEDLRAQIDGLGDHTSAVEQELRNAFNSFRLLSNTQFIENRVYEEDETVVATQDEGEEQHRVESYEDDIRPRYKEAVMTAWNEHLKFSGSRETRLPFIIGSEDFMRDSLCGLQESSSQVSREYDSEAEKDGVNMAAEMVVTGVISDEEWSDPNNEPCEDQDNHEPAVSAALDFKAMLEAALRASYVPNDGQSLNAENGTAVVDNGSDKENVISRDDDAQTTIDEILGRIAQEANPQHYSAVPKEETSRPEVQSQLFPPMPQQYASSESSHWSDGEEESPDRSEVKSKNSHFSQGSSFPEQEKALHHDKQKFEQENFPVETAQTGSTETSSRLKSLFDDDDDDEVDENVEAPGSKPQYRSSEFNETSAVQGPSNSFSFARKSLFDDDDDADDDNETAEATESKSQNPLTSAFNGATTPALTKPASAIHSDTPAPFRSNRLASLLFGDDENDDEGDALFGPRYTRV